jgi:C1A family cysteine protease
LDIPKDNIGGHAMIITGVRINSDGTRDFWVRNSWGESFGIGGHVWFSDKYIAWNQSSDFFVPTRMVDFTI